MESREELVRKGLGFLGRSEVRRQVYEKVNGRRDSISISKELKISKQQAINEIKKLKDFGLIKEKKKIGNTTIFEKEPSYAHLNLHNRKRFPAKKEGISEGVQNADKTANRNRQIKKHLKKLVSFEGKYPEIFYNRLEKEINEAYNNPLLPNAVLMLSRKLIENLLFNILEKKYPRKRELWWQEQPPRPLDFSILLNNLVINKSGFTTDEQELIEKFNMLVKPFIKTANQTTHRLMNYLEKMVEIKNYKIPEIVQILIKIYNKV